MRIAEGSPIEFRPPGLELGAQLPRGIRAAILHHDEPIGDMVASRARCSASAQVLAGVRKGGDWSLGALPAEMEANPEGCQRVAGGR